MSFKILGMGEALWDLLPSGPQLGGAPVNFACHARALGAEAGVITRVGNDPDGRAIIDLFEKMRMVGGDLQVDNTAPTGTATVLLSGKGIPHFSIRENVAWDNLQNTPQALKAVCDADAICFGSLAQRNEPARSSIQSLLGAARESTIRIFDANLRDQFSREIIGQSLKLANMLKLNEEELDVLGKMFTVEGSIQARLEKLAGLFRLKLIALTRGPFGSLLYREGEWSDCSPVPVKVMDTVGAGDAFTAALVFGMLRKMPLRRVNELANEVARYVCSRAGATPSLPKRIRDRFASGANL